VREYVEVRVKSVLNRVEGMPFRWSINPYRGCAHGCPFCYARKTHWFLDQDGVADWSRRIFVKVNAPDILRAELARPTWRREEVAVGTATDPYQPIEGKYRITRRILEALVDFRTPASLVTRSPLVVRDLDVLQDLARGAHVTVCVSIATLDARLARELEPGVAPPTQRLRAVARLVHHGIPVGVLLAPILPGLTDAPKNLQAVIRAACDHGAHFVGHNVLYLGQVTREAFFGFLRERHPDLVPLYERLYPQTYAPRAYTEAVGRIVTAYRARSGFGPSRPRARPTPEQLELFPYDRMDASRT
jgi:DNA repair photolyase